MLHFSLLTNCLCVNLKSCFIFLNASSSSASCPCLYLNLSCFGLLNISSRSARCWVDSTVSIFLALFCSTPPVALLCDRFVFVWIFLALFCSTTRVALLIIDMSPSQSFLLWFPQHLESLCLLLTWLDCLDISCFVLLRTSSRSVCGTTSRSVRGRFVSVSIFLAMFSLTPRVALPVGEVVSTVSTFLNTSTRPGHCSDVSDSYVNTLTYVELFLASFAPLCRSNLPLLMFHSP